MSDVLYLAWRYLGFHRWKTVILVGAMTIILFLPLALEQVLDRGVERLSSRARATPLLVGAPGSPLELVLGSLYYSEAVQAPLAYSVVRDVADSGLALPIPLALGHRVGDHPVVGTSPDYVAFRGLNLASGRAVAMAGEALVGASAASSLGVSVGDTVVTAPDTVFDVTGNYPLELRVVGILAPAGTPDDGAVLVDVRTAWILAGIGHGHDDLVDDAGGAVMGRAGDTVVANASVVTARAITPDNRADFHFHGDTDDFPISALIAVPRDAKSGVLLEGRYAAPGSAARVLRPADVMDELIGTVFTVRQYVLAGTALLGAATVATVTLVFLLSTRLRRGEIRTLGRIGAAPGRVAAMLGAEVAIVLTASVLLAGLLVSLAVAFGDEILRWLLVSAR